MKKCFHHCSDRFLFLVRLSIRDIDDDDDGDDDDDDDDDDDITDRAYDDERNETQAALPFS